MNKTWRRTLPILGRIGLMTVVLLAGGLGMRLFTYSTVEKDSDLDHQRHFNDSYKVFSLTLPNELSFCDEQVPMDRLDVRERLDRELLVNTYWQSNTVLVHKRANRWFPLISAVLEREGVPDDMKYIAVIESGFANVVSPAGAAGPWQFLKATALSYGLEVTEEVDERYHMEKSTAAAARYLKDAYATHQDWALAAASYNLGQGGVNKQLTRQRTEHYFDLQLPEETSRYVFRILAMKEIMRDPERYGFHLRKQDLYAPYRTRSVEVSSTLDDLAVFAQNEGTDYRTLKLLNPWLRDSKLTVRPGITYSVLLPAEGFNETGTID